MTPTQIDRTAGEIDWPAWAERVPRRERTSGSKFQVTPGKAISDLAKELDSRLDVDAWRLSTAAPHRKRDGLPYADSNPDDPGVVVRWSKGGEQYAVCCDNYRDMRSNIRAIGLYIREKRKMANRPVQTGQDEFATARLPEGNPERDGEKRKPPHEILEVAPDASPETVKAVSRRKLADNSPDTGGDRDEFIRIKKARDAMLEGLE